MEFINNDEDNSYEPLHSIRKVNRIFIYITSTQKWVSESVSHSVRTVLPFITVPDPNSASYALLEVCLSNSLKSFARRIWNGIEAGKLIDMTSRLFMLPPPSGRRRSIHFMFRFLPPTHEKPPGTASSLLGDRPSEWVVTTRKVEKYWGKFLEGKRATSMMVVVVVTGET